MAAWAKSPHQLPRNRFQLVRPQSSSDSSTRDVHHLEISCSKKPLIIKLRPSLLPQGNIKLYMEPRVSPSTIACCSKADVVASNSHQRKALELKAKIRRDK